jgi:hypothetical protein
VGGEAAGDERQRIGVRQMARERELDRALQLLDAHGDPHEDAAVGGVDSHSKSWQS